MLNFFGAMLPSSGAPECRGRLSIRRRLMLSGGVATILGGCGFQLRRAPDFVFDSILILGDVNSGLANQLRRELAADGRLLVLPLGTDPAKAKVILDLPVEQREKVVVGLNASGQVREFQLRLRARFRLRTSQGRELIPETELLQQRDISFNESAVLSKEGEESRLYRDMQTQVVQQLMRRLAALKAV
jgi:LPS-assembly lipoprotein